MHLPLERAQAEMARILTGEGSRVLRTCTSCQACNLFCPEDCRPANLILDLWHEAYLERGLPARAAFLLPHSRPNFRTEIIRRLPPSERQMVTHWRREDPAPEFLFSGCNLITTPYLTRSKLFEGIEIRGGLDYCCGEMVFRMGLYEALEQVAARLTAWFRRLGAERVYLVCTAGLNMLRNVLPQFGADFDGIEFVPYLEAVLGRLEAGDLGQVQPLDLAVTVQDSCHARVLEPDFDELPRKVLEAAGVEVREAPHSRDEQLCCGIGGGFSHASAYHPLDLLLSARNTSRDQRRTGADATCVYCSGCLEMMSVGRLPDPNRRPVYHILELVQQALGEEPARTSQGQRLARQDGLAVQFVLSAMRHQFPGLLSPRRFWQPDLPVIPEAEEAM
jgi:Fe-S oxidoreductase